MEWFRRFYQKEFMNLVGFPPQEQTEREAAFAAEALELSADSSLLDLCCGYGRHTFEIASKTGCRVTGFDLSPDFLAIARTEFAAPNIRYVEGDMRRIPMEAEFDAVINLFTSFGYFETDEENETVLQGIYRALRPGGRFLLDFENKFHFIFRDVMKEYRYWYEFPENQYVLTQSHYDVIREREILDAKLIQNGEVTDHLGYNIRLYSYPEIQKMLSANGFHVLSVWGDFDRSPFSVHSRRVIILSSRAG